MFYSSILFLSIAVFFGIALLAYVLGSKQTPKSLALAHGGAAFVGLVLAIVYALKGPPGAVQAAVLLAIAAAGGFFMFVRDLLGRSVPKWLAVTHGVLALGGLGFLLYSGLAV